MRHIKNSIAKSLVAAFIVTTSLHAAPSAALELDTFVPDTAFLQLGAGEKQTQTYMAGVAWDWSWERRYSWASFTGYSEISFGRWVTEIDNQQQSSWVTQLGVTPVLRMSGTQALRDWFIEIGIGANLILPVYRSEEKSFSTEFNFGDHIAVGHYWGQQREHELSLRAQHFSNAGIDHPNPGENFLQLRYSRHFGAGS